MNYLGDFFALGLVFVLFIFFFESRTSGRYLTLSSKWYLLALVMTALTAVADMVTCQLMTLSHVPLWLNMAVNSLYFVLNILATSAIAVFLFHKVLEHTYGGDCMKQAQTGLAVLFSIYMLLVITNLWTGWLFYFDAAGTYHRGPLNGAGYLVTLCQMALVLICYLRNAQRASHPMRRALAQTFPVAVICIIIQRIYPQVMLNCFIMSMVETVLFLSFHGQRQDVNALTELNGRRRFFRELELRIGRKEKFQLFLINLKHFGEINQKYGHRFGDELLYQFAFSLERIFPVEQAYHMNGTVFALVLPYTSQADAVKKGSKLLAFMEKGMVCQGRQITFDFAMADYAVTEQERDAADLYEKLEYSVAKAYRDHLHHIRYTPEIGAEMSRIQYLLERMQVVDRAHGFEVWCQPIQHLSTGEFTSMEALVRLREPDGSLISPMEFIPLAEKTGRIAAITWFVIEDACRLLRTNTELEGASISVNLPMQQLLEEGFTARLNNILDRAGLDHSRICLEFTERAILENFQSTLQIMKQLTQEGYRFYLDDFGTGYSNFNCLLQLPFQIIKLDASLVRPDREGKHNYPMVHTLTKLFHDMSLTVVAEGVETAQEVAQLKDLGVDRIQGYALARPMPEKDLLTFYREHSVT